MQNQRSNGNYEQKSTAYVIMHFITISAIFEILIDIQQNAQMMYSSHMLLTWSFKTTR